LSIHVQREVVSVLSVPTVATIVVVVRVPTLVVFVRFTGREVHAAIDVEVEVFETVYRVVSFEVADKYFRFTFIGSRV
jgi:hypothetical protein